MQPECSVLVDALEQSACNPEIANAFATSLHHILLLSAEKTFASFKTLDAVSRVLKVSCIQSQESRRSEDISSSNHGHQISNSGETAQNWHQCIETCMKIFMEFWSISDEARSLVLHSSTCIDCLFDLFWEQSLRNKVFKYIHDLMKVFPFTRMLMISLFNC